jgi:hypothetical protein
MKSDVRITAVEALLEELLSELSDQNDTELAELYSCCSTIADHAEELLRDRHPGRDFSDLISNLRHNPKWAEQITQRR